MFHTGNIYDAFSQLPVEGVGILFQPVAGPAQAVGNTGPGGRFEIYLPNEVLGDLILVHPAYFTKRIGIGQLEATRAATITPKPATLSGLGAVAYVEQETGGQGVVIPGSPIIASYMPANDIGLQLGDFQTVETMNPTANQRVANDVQTATDTQPPADPGTTTGAKFPWLLVGAGAAVYMLSKKSKRKKVGKVQWENYILPVGILVGGYLVFDKFFGGSKDNDTNNNQVDQQVQAGNKQMLAQLASAGQVPTLSQSFINSLAADILAQSTLSVFTTQTTTEGMQQILTDMTKLRNTADIYALKLAFGTKKLATSWYSTCALLGFNCQALDLDSVVKLACAPDYIQAMNNWFAMQGVNYSF